jgi:hypothetical protein
MKKNKNVLFSKFGPEKTGAKFDRLIEKVLAHQELIARDGHLSASWKTYRGKRLGPYYRVEFRDGGARRKIYLGRDAELAELAGLLLEELKRPAREKRHLRQLRAAILASYRRGLVEIDPLLAPLGFYRRGTRFCKRR